MSEQVALLPPIPHVAVADANVLYSRILRDYLLYAAEQEIITVVWSRKILAEMCEHLIVNLPHFNQNAAHRLIGAMTATFTDSNFDPGPEDFARLRGLALPDEDDRHVIATALAAEANIICTNNIKDFPRPILAQLGITVMTPDELFTGLFNNYPAHMMEAHRTVVDNFVGANDKSTVNALRRAHAPHTAELLAAALGAA